MVTSAATADQITAAAESAGYDEATTLALVEDYEAAQIQSLKVGLPVAAILALVSLAFTKDLPHESSAARGDLAAVSVGE